MKADFHIQDWADLRVSTNPPSHAGCFSLRGKVYSRHDPFKLSSVSSSSVMKKCPFSIFFEKPAFEQSLVNFSYSGSSANFCSFSRNNFPRTSASVYQVELAASKYVGKATASIFSAGQGFPYLMSLSNSPHRSATAPWRPSWLTQITVRKFNSMVSSLPLKWTDFTPLPFAFESPLSNELVARKRGCPLSAKLSIMPQQFYPILHLACGDGFRTMSSPIQAPEMTSVLAWIFEHTQ